MSYTELETYKNLLENHLKYTEFILNRKRLTDDFEK